MEKETIFNSIKQFIGGKCFKVFLWSIEKTEERYFFEIYKQEKENIETIHERTFI